MASGEGSSSGASVSSSVPTGDIGPLWDYVTRLEKTSEISGTWRFQCTLCNEIRLGTYSRVKAHLLQLRNRGIAICKKVTRPQKIEMEKLEEEFEVSKKNSRAREVPLPCATTTTNKRPRASSSTQSPLEKAFDMDARTQLDQEIARMFYTGGLPFNLARNPYYMSSYTFAANHSLGGYVPPGYNKLRTTLLNQERSNVDRLLQPLKSVWCERGVTIVTDGWSDPQRKPLINFMVTSGSGPMFLKAVNCFGEIKDKFFISNLMKEVIDEVGHKNVVQIITDNAANCKGAGEIIEGMYPHIYWTPCVVHTLNLALKNICAPKHTEANEETFKELGAYPHGGIVEELGKRTQLRRLVARERAEGNSEELLASVMKMQGLLSLTLEAQNCIKQHVFLPKSFSPPPLLSKLRLEGLLEKIPNCSAQWEVF